MDLSHLPLTLLGPHSVRFPDYGQRRRKMEERTTFGRRAARLAAFAVGGGVALTLALSSAASAQDVTVQEAEVANTGVAVANSGGNVAVGNTSENEAEVEQEAEGGLLAVELGERRPTSPMARRRSRRVRPPRRGATSGTGITQEASGDDGGGLSVAVQEADVVNAGRRRCQQRPQRRGRQRVGQRRRGGPGRPTAYSRSTRRTRPTSRTDRRRSAPARQRQRATSPAPPSRRAPMAAAVLA